MDGFCVRWTQHLKKILMHIKTHQNFLSIIFILHPFCSPGTHKFLILYFLSLLYMIIICSFQACMNEYRSDGRLGEYDSILSSAFEFDIHQVIKDCRYLIAFWCIYKLIILLINGVNSNHFASWLKYEGIYNITWMHWSPNQESPIQ